MLCEKIDGIYCDKCKTMHPTLFWHELYDDYRKPLEEYIPYIKQMHERFAQMTITDAEAIEHYNDLMRILKLERCDEKGKCEICGTLTHYKYTPANKYICSDKCKYEIKSRVEI